VDLDGVVKNKWLARVKGGPARLSAQSTRQEDSGQGYRIAPQRSRAPGGNTCHAVSAGRQNNVGLLLLSSGVRQAGETCWRARPPDTRKTLYSTRINHNAPKDTMPTYHVEMMEGRTVEQKKKLVEAITRVSVEILGGQPDSVDILITDIKRENWATGGKLWSEPRD
jgi:4-oxalocrotonate tautomerase